MKLIYKALDKSLKYPGLIFIVIITGVLMTTTNVLVGRIKELSGQGVMDLEFGISVARVKEILGAYGAESIRIYEQIQVVDMIVPALVAWLVAMAIYGWVRNTRWSWLVIFAVFVALMDYVENFYYHQIFVSYPIVDPDIVSSANIVSIAKNIITMTGVGIVIFAVLQKVFFLIKNKIRK